MMRTTMARHQGMGHVIGIDPSLTGTGVCRVVDGVVEATLVFSTPSTQARPARLCELRDRVRGIVEAATAAGDPAPLRTIVAMESEVFMGSAFQASEQGAIQAVYQVMLYELDTEHVWLHYLPVNVAHVKKWLGARLKDEILLQVYKRYGVEFRDHNAADAYTLAMIGDSYAAYALDGKTWPEWTKPQLEVLDKLAHSGFPWERPPVKKGKRKILPRARL